MAIDGKIRYEKLQNYINREVAKISVLPSGKIDKYEYLIGEEMLSSDQSKMINKISLIIHFWEKLLESK